MNVIPHNLNFHLLWPFLKYCVFIIVLGVVGGYITRFIFAWVPKKERGSLMNFGIGLGVFAGIYVCTRWFT